MEETIRGKFEFEEPYWEKQSEECEPDGFVSLPSFFFADSSMLFAYSQGVHQATPANGSDEASYRCRCSTTSRSFFGSLLPRLASTTHPSFPSSSSSVAYFSLCRRVRYRRRTATNLLSSSGEANHRECSSRRPPLSLFLSNAHLHRSYLVFVFNFSLISRTTLMKRNSAAELEPPRFQRRRRRRRRRRVKMECEFSISSLFRLLSHLA